uniref:Uncharacterized protein n=1 Tax=Anguilla anguilla TaxID=7936 RepID=A0A0E9S8L0_ANGAN
MTFGAAVNNACFKTVIFGINENIPYNKLISCSESGTYYDNI